MALFQFVGTGTAVADFTVDDAVISAPLVRGEARMYSEFPYPTLENWRRRALVASATIPVLSTRVRTALLFAHEADLKTMFLELTEVDPEALAGRYNFKKKANLADKELELPLTQIDAALKELAEQKIPEQYRELMEKRLRSENFNHRVAGLCAAVYFTALLLEEAEAIS